MLEIEELFGAQGALGKAFPDYRPRRSQQQMAARVALAIEERRPLLVEAGTGTGKTFAYLVPAMLSGRRVIVSTGTRTLQDQLYSRDLPLLSRAIGRPLTVALLKGRGNYLCRERLSALERQQTFELFDRGERKRLREVIEWAEVTRTGDLAELPALSDTSELRASITSTRENCLGQRCPVFAKCHVVLARRAAAEADLVVVNHHLLLADFALKEEGFGDLLGSADAVILDEAHQLPDLATEFFGVDVSSRQVEHLLSDTRAQFSGGVHARESQAAMEPVEAALLRSKGAWSAPAPGESQRKSWTDAPVSFDSAIDDLIDALEDLHTRLAGLDGSPQTLQLAARAAGLADHLTRIARLRDEEGVRSVVRHAHGYQLSMLPFDVAPRFRAIVDARPVAWVFTSATLAVGEDFGHFAHRLGLADAESLRIESPFDFEQQALLYLPPNMPDPSSADYLDAVLKEAQPLIEAAQGGAFILFTSHRALARAAAWFAARPEGTLAYPLLVQGAAPRERLLTEFRALGNAVLLGTTSFWEGVDVKGDALRLVVIEKLPFASPDDPLVRARIQHLESQGGSAFRDYQLPEAALALKQGVGRLIRSEEDRGVVAICDPRLITRSYGRVLRASLPPFTPTRERGEAERFLARCAG